MRKTTSYHYSEGDVKKIVKTEFEVAKLEWLGEFKSLVTKFKDEVLTGLDKVMVSLRQSEKNKSLIPTEIQNTRKLLRITKPGSINLKTPSNPLKFP